MSYRLEREACLAAAGPRGGRSSIPTPADPNPTRPEPIVTSNRRRKQRAQPLGLTEAERQLTELLGEVLELFGWNQLRGCRKPYLLHEKLSFPPEERHLVMKAAAGAREASSG